MATKHNTHRLWSSNVTYTGLTKIHSDTQPGATARNTLANRRASCSLATESNLHQKELRALNFNKQALKNSMLAYTQKMQTLSAEKLDQTFARKMQARAKTDFPRSHEPSINGAILRQVSGEAFVHVESHSRKEQDFHEFLNSSSNSRKDGNAETRLSIDSGICVDHMTDNPELLSDNDNHDFSDSCCSDSESIASYLSTKSESWVPSHLKETNKTEGTAISDSESMSQDNTPRRKKRFRRKWRIGKENPLLPPVQDNESADDECSYTLEENEMNSDFSIQPFPVDSSLKNDNLSGPVPSTISGPISSSEFYRAHYGVKTTAEEQNVILKPKPVQSPSVTSIRMRYPRNKPKQDNKPFHHHFRYSEQFEETPGGLNICNGHNVSHSTQLPCNLQELSMGTIEEMSPELETEDSISVSPLAEIDAFANVQIISKRSEKMLKSALKPKRQKEIHKSRHVHFFLPDIFKE